MGEHDIISTMLTNERISKIIDAHIFTFGAGANFSNICANTWFNREEPVFSGLGYGRRIIGYIDIYARYEQDDVIWEFIFEIKQTNDFNDVGAIIRQLRQYDALTPRPDGRKMKLRRLIVVSNEIPCLAKEQLKQSGIHWIDLHRSTDFVRTVWTDIKQFSFSDVSMSIGNNNLPLAEYFIEDLYEREILDKKKDILNVD